VSDLRVVQVYGTRPEAEVAAKKLNAELIETSVRELEPSSFALEAYSMDVARGRRVLSLGCFYLERDPGRSFVKAPCSNCGEPAVRADHTFFMQSLVTSLFVALFSRSFEPMKRRWECTNCLVCWIYAAPSPEPKPAA
jgi:hypothetical protein